MNTKHILRGDDFTWYLGETIGEGRFGVVSLATDESGRVAAVKMLKPEYAENEVAVRRLLRELAAMRELQHPAFPQVFGQGMSEHGAPFFVMELIHGESLESLRLRQGGRIPVDLALSVARQALDALEYAHAIGWLHRDINPCNLLVAADGSLRVLDLGVCRAIESSGVLASSTGPTLLGTPGFIAPEQARGNWGEVDERSDLWSLGATLFVLLSGHPVHPGGTDAPTQAAVSVSPRSLGQVMPALPGPIASWIDKALAFSPEHRWVSASAMNRALQDIEPVTPSRITLVLEPGGDLDASPHCPATIDRSITRPSEDCTLFALWLVYSPDSQARCNLQLPQAGAVIIGRDANKVTWCINDQLISRKHASIHWCDDEQCYRVIDQASRNGVEVNGTRCNTQRLQEGDVIRLGASLLVVVDETARCTFARTLEEIAHSSCHLLLLGESGVGREHLARMIHNRSGRRGAFVPLDCAALDSNFGARELFGLRMADAGESQLARTGLVQAAESGTLFLNEVATLPPSLQSLLSRALRRSKLRPLGAAMEVEMDVRVVATATCAEGSFPAEKLRLDLYAALADQKLHVPALRRRRHEILSILGEIATSEGLELEITADAAEALLLGDWPTNVCGLRQLIVRISRAHGKACRLDLAQLRDLERDMLVKLTLQKHAPINPSTQLETARAVLHRKPALERLLEDQKGNVARAAKTLGVPRMEIYRSMKKLGIDVRLMRETR